MQSSSQLTKFGAASKTIFNYPSYAETRRGFVTNLVELEPLQPELVYGRLADR